VLEAGRGGLIKYGPGFRQCHVGVVSNVYEDHLGFDGINTLEEMAEVKSLIPLHTHEKGFIVLNGDDDLVRRMVHKTRAAPIYFVTQKSPDQFERVFFLRGNSIFKRIADQEEAVIDVRELSVTYGGLLSFNIPNVMAALAAVEGTNKLLPVDSDSIRKTLWKFGSEPLDNIKRFSVVTYKGEWVVLGYSKNPESVRRDVEVIRTLKDRGGFRHVVGVLSAVGNREEKYYRQISELVAPVCDYFFVRPPKDKYLRGRSGEEIVGLLSGGIPGEKILSTRPGSLSEVFASTRERLEGKILFVIFLPVLEDTVDFWELLKETQFQSPRGIRELLNT
jgi:cyanophycin synthetase